MHAARTLFAENYDEEEWGFLLVDAANTFNAGNRIACLWTVWHMWSSGARFSMNCCRHQALLFVRADDRYAGHWLASCEGDMQGNPLAIILYGIGMLLLTLQLKVEVSTSL